MPPYEELKAIRQSKPFFALAKARRRQRKPKLMEPQKAGT
jgi:hypothetical protein